MNNFTHILAADAQAIERRASPPPVVYATPAAKIVAEGERKRREYRTAHSTADSAMIYGAQVGYLHGMIVELCNKLANFDPKRDTNLLYAEVYCDELGCDVLAGYTYSPGEDAQTSGPPENCHEGSPEELELCEVWVDGTDIAAVILERVAEQLTAAALAHMHDEQESAQAESRSRGWA